MLHKQGSTSPSTSQHQHQPRPQRQWARKHEGNTTHGDLHLLERPLAEHLQERLAALGLALLPRERVHDDSLRPAPRSRAVSREEEGGVSRESSLPARLGMDPNALV